MPKRGVSSSTRINNHGRPRRSTRLKKEVVVEEDRLSCLPDEILTNILSFLPIKSAAVTSALSHRWRHLWTGVTRFVYHYDRFREDDSEKFTPVVGNILAKLTSPILRVFHLRIQDLSDLCKSDAVLRQVCSRNVQHLIIDANVFNDNEDLFRVPVAGLIQAAHSLVTLQLSGMIKLFDFPSNDDNSRVGFPNLKNLSLYHLADFYPWLATLIGSSPLLEELNLVFHLFLAHNNKSESEPHDAQSSFNVFAPNLESLHITTIPEDTPPRRRMKVFIDAPKLTDISVCDCNWCYYLVQSPTSLATAWLTLNVDPYYEEDFVAADDDYVHQMAKFVAELSSVCELKLHLDPYSNVYSLLPALLPIFPNLKCLTTSLKNIGLISWKDLLHSLRCFPNLKHLEVRMDYKEITDRGMMTWSAPDYVPDCLISKLKTIKITGLDGILEELRLLTYILRNATTLNKLEVYIRHDCGRGLSREVRLWNACKFCWSLFDLRRVSPTCEVYFWGGHVEASSNDFNFGLTCKISTLD